MEVPKNPDKLRYYSKRPLKNDEGKIEGSITIYVIEDKKVAKIGYECPFCGYEGETEIKLSLTKKRGRGENYKLEFPFKFKCENCGVEFEIERMNPQG